MLKTGEADVISVSRERSPELKEAGFHIFTKSRWSILGMYFHEQWRPEVPISKLKVRQALNLAINRKELAQYVFAGMAAPAVAYPIPSRAPGADQALEPYPYDPEKAKQLLKEAGYPNGFEITMYSYPRADVPEMPRFIEAVAGYFEEIGVKAKIIPTEYASYRKKRLGFDLPGQMGALAAPNRPLAGFVSLMRILVQSNGRFTSMKDPEMDRMIEQMEGTLDEAEAQQHLTEIYRYLYQHYNHLSVVDLDLPYATSKEITKWDLGGAVWDQNFLYLVRQ
jgi:peptide/nickel transport system substrate-binding protein